MDSSNLLDTFLLKASLDYHGPLLLEKLQAEQQLNMRHLLPETPSGLSKHPRDEFNQCLLKFIAKKADLLFAKEGSCDFDWPCKHVNEDHFAVIPPLEHFMTVQKAQRTQHFYKDIECGNIIIGMVTAVQENGFLLNVLTVEIGQIRCLDQLKLVGFCPLREIPRSRSHDDVLESFNLRDKVRAVVLNVQEDRLIVSLQERHLPASVDLHLGLVNDEELPLHYRRLLESLESGGVTYESYLSQVLEFHNPSSVANLTSMFGIKEYGQQPSLMRGLFRVKYKEEDYGDRLRKGQSYRLAMKSVAQGVKLFKNGENLEAMQLFNRALQIDSENIEALVARGALYANCESYERAISDFEEAIRLNPSHANAQKYLHQTLTAFVYSLMDRKPDLAVSYARRALELYPNNEETASLMKQTQQKLEDAQKVSPTSSDSGHDINENESVINHAKEILVKMIQEDQYGRSGHQKSRSLSEGSDKLVANDRRLSHDSSELSRQGQHLFQNNDENKNTRHLSNQSPKGERLRHYSKDFKTLKTLGHFDSSMELKQESTAVFGPALPPAMSKKKTRKQRKKSYKSSSSSSSSSSSRSSSSTSSSSYSSSSSSPYSAKKRSKNSGSSRKSLNKRNSRRSSRHEKINTEEVNKGTSAELRNKRQTSREVDQVRKVKERDISRSSECRNSRFSPSYERSAKKVKLDREHSDYRRNRNASVSRRRGNDEYEKKNRSRNESTSKKLFVDYSSSSSENCSESRNEKNRKESNTDQVKKEIADSRPPEGETLEDLEQFLQQLKAKKALAK